MKYVGLYLLLAIGVVIAGCDGDGFDWPAPVGDSAGVPDSGEPDDGTDGDDTDSPDVVVPGSSEDPRFKGSWIASFRDEYSSDGNSYVYAVRLTLRRGLLLGNLTGEARVARFRQTDAEADENWETFTASIRNASSNGDYAQLDLSDESFSPNPSFYFRSAGDRMVGMFVALRDNTLVRAGTMTWHKASEGSVVGNWVAAVRDARSSLDADIEDSGPLRDRRAGLTLNVPSGQTDGAVTGLADFVQLQDTGGLLNLGSNVEGAFDASEFVFTCDPYFWEEGKVIVPDLPMDWTGRFSEDVYVGAFAQWNHAGEWTRSGSATWYKQPDELDSDLISNVWVTAFSDTVSADGDLKSYVGSMKLTRSGGILTPANVEFRQESGDSGSSYRSYSTGSGNIEAKGDIQLELRSSRDKFVWDLYLTGSLLVGVYERLSLTDEFLARGVAEWRVRTNKSLVGSWAASFNDEEANGSTTERPSLAYVTIDEGETSGNGSILTANDDVPLSFNLTATKNGNKIDWTWAKSAGQLSGETVWHLRVSGDTLVGTFTNYDNTGAEEQRGHAVWARTDSD